MEDCSRFFMSRIYRELGFSLDECVGLAERDLAEVTDCMHEREKALLGEARMLENLSREAGRLHGLMDRIARGDTGPARWFPSRWCGWKACTLRRGAHRRMRIAFGNGLATCRFLPLRSATGAKA